MPSHGLFWMSYRGASSNPVGFTPLCKRVWVKGLLLVPWFQCLVLVSAHRNTLHWWPGSAHELELKAGESDINTAGWIFQFAISHSLPAPWCLCMVWVCHSKGKFSSFNGDIPPFHGKSIISRALWLSFLYLFSLSGSFLGLLIQKCLWVRKPFLFSTSKLFFILDNIDKPKYHSNSF